MSTSSIQNYLKSRTGDDWSFNPSLTSMPMQECKWNPDPTDGQQVEFPTSQTAQTFQLITIQGSAVLELTTASGFFVWLPAQLEKVMCWHVPTDVTTRTFGTPQRIDFSIDADAFYERYKVIVSCLRIQAGTVSVTNAALAGNATGVAAYNSLASLVGNGSDVFQIYSFENGPGLTPEVEGKVVGVQSWNGVSMLFCNNPDTPVQRLEDSVVFETQDCDASFSAAKFVNDNETYDLNINLKLSDAAKVFTLPGSLGGSPYHRVNLGKYLKDAVRASSIDWAFTTTIIWAANGPVGTVLDNKVQIVLGYELEDITETIVKTGVMYSRQYKIPTATAVPSQAEPIVLSGSVPDALNINEQALVLPIRQFNLFFEVRNLSTEDMVIALDDFYGSIRYPILNGLTHGLIQEPRLIMYTGAEIGTKMTVMGSTRVEAYPDATRSKFVNNLHRDYNEEMSIAIKKVLHNPVEYGVRWAMPASAFESLIETFLGAIAIAYQQEASMQLMSILMQMIHMVKAHNITYSDGSQKSIVHEASIKKLARRGLRVFKKLGSSAFNDVIKPAIEQEWEQIKQLPLTAAKQILQTTLQPMMTQYIPPSVNYPVPSNNVVSVRRAAAAGFIPKSPTARFNACTFNVEEIGATDECKNQAPVPEANIGATEENQNFYVQFSERYNAAYKVPQNVTPFKRPQKIEKAFSPKEFTVPFDKINVFTTINIESGTENVAEQDNTTVDGFVIVPTSLVPAELPGIATTRVGDRTIENFSYYKDIKDPLKVVPKTDIGLFRIKRINYSKGLIDCETTHKPVGGRSLEFALAMFNNGIHGLVAFVGAVEGGNIMAQADPNAALKRGWCNKNGITTVGNGNFDIRVATIVEALQKMRKMTQPKLSSVHFNASTGVDLRRFDIPEFSPYKQFMTQGTKVDYVLDEEAPDEVILHFDNLVDVIRISKISELPAQVNKFGRVVIDNGTDFDVYILPSIASRHKLCKSFLRAYWAPKLQTTGQVSMPEAEYSIPVAMTQPFDVNGRKGGRGRGGYLKAGRSQGRPQGIAPYRVDQPLAQSMNDYNLSLNYPSGYGGYQVNPMQFQPPPPLPETYVYPNPGQIQIPPHTPQSNGPAQPKLRRRRTGQVGTAPQGVPKTFPVPQVQYFQKNPPVYVTQKQRENFSKDLAKADNFQNDEILKEAESLKVKLYKKATRENKFNQILFYLQNSNIYQFSQVLRAISSTNGEGLSPLAKKYWNHFASHPLSKPINSLEREEEAKRLLSVPQQNTQPTQTDLMFVENDTDIPQTANAQASGTFNGATASTGDTVDSIITAFADPHDPHRT